MAAWGITDITPNDNNSSLTEPRSYQSVSGKALCVAISNDGTRAYLGGLSGVWRSDYGGDWWWHPVRPQPAPGVMDVPGALTVPNVYDLLISPTNNDVVIAFTGHDERKSDQGGIYLSTDGAWTWTRTHQFSGTGQLVAGQLSQAPFDPNQPNAPIYAAGGSAIVTSTDGVQWTDCSPSLNQGETVWHVAAGKQGRVYAVGSNGSPNAPVVWYSEDGCGTWSRDSLAPALQAGPAIAAGGLGAHVLAVHPTEPHIVYLIMGDGTIWQGIFLPSAPGLWRQLPSLPIIPNGPTPSGANFIVPFLTAEGTLFLFASDRRTVCVSAGEPQSQLDWTRVDGDSHCHADPHDLALSADFHPWLVSSGTRGRALLVNDGGANVSTDGAQSWSNARGLPTLSAINIAVNTIPGKRSLLAFGTGDNSGFCSSDSGATWQTQDYKGGDNDCYFSDPLQPTRMVVFAPRGDPQGTGIYLYASPGKDQPDIADGTGESQAIPAPDFDPVAKTLFAFPWNVESAYFNVGYRPIVMTLPSEQPRSGGDFVTIRFAGQQAQVLRTTALSKITRATDWDTTDTDEGPHVKAFLVGPPLPLPGCVVQASGGHDQTVFFAADPVRFDSNRNPGDGSGELWRLDGDTWDSLLVPRLPLPRRTGPTSAWRFFIDPYRPNILYVLGSDHIYFSEDGGGTWVVDKSLERMVTANGAFPLDIPATQNQLENPDDATLNDMQFDPDLPGVRFASGPAGVFYTVDGVNWDHALVAESVAIRIASITYDPRWEGRPLYVATTNRGVLRLTRVADIDLTALAEPEAPSADGDPAAGVAADGSNHAIYRSHDGHLHELWWTDGTAVGHGDLTANNIGIGGDAPPAVGEPAIFVATDGTNQAIYRGHDGHLHEMWWTTGDVGHGDLTANNIAAGGDAPPSAGDPAVFIATDNTNQVIYRSHDGHLHEMWWTTGDVGHGDLTANNIAAGGDAPPAAGDPAVFIATDNTNQVIYRSHDGHLHEMWWTTGTVGQGDLTANNIAAGGDAPPSVDDPVVFIASDQTNQVIYRSHDGHLHEMWWTTGTVGQGDLNAVAGPSSPPAVGLPAAYLSAPDLTNHVIYRDRNDHMHEMWWTTGAVGEGDLTAIAFAPAAAGRPVAYFTSADRTHHVVYRSHDGHIHELRWSS